jgi:hypothetical protein
MCYDIPLSNILTPFRRDNAMNKKQYLQITKEQFDIYNKFKSPDDMVFTLEQFGWLMTLGWQSKSLDKKIDEFTATHEFSEENQYKIITMLLASIPKKVKFC